MKQPDMYVVSLIADFFLYTRRTQVSLFVCWGIGKFTCNCILLFSTTFIIIIIIVMLIVKATATVICEFHQLPGLLCLQYVTSCL